MSAQRWTLSVLLILALLAPGAAASGEPEPDRGLAQQATLELSTAVGAAPVYSVPDWIGAQATELARAAQITGGEHHTCALTEGGRVKCWGSNDDGQLGDGTTTQRSTPVDVDGLSSGVAAVAAGGTTRVVPSGIDYGGHTCALTVGGGVKCWGGNRSGQLGDGTTTDRWTPVDVTGLSSGVAAIATGSDHTCALTQGGGVKCWGGNRSGQLGDGTMTDRWAPADVTGLSNGVVAVAAGGNHTCALTTGGGVKCWGQNLDGQLGDGTTTGRTTPVDVVGLSSGVAAVATGSYHTCALTESGGVKCWGNNISGQLGDGTTTGRTTAVDVTGLNSGVAAVATGGGHTCTLIVGGRVKCWGNNSSGRLGDGTTTNRTTPVDVTGLSSGVAAVAAGGGHTCALTEGGGIMCWGANTFGQLGEGTAANRTMPVDVTGLSSGGLAVAAGYEHTCVLMDTAQGGGVKCWGYNRYGQLGDGTTTSRWPPVDVSGLSSGVAAVAAGGGDYGYDWGGHTCALIQGGGVKCWGANWYGQLGDGTRTNRTTPVDVTGLSNGVAAVAAGGNHTCALTTGGGVKCWGLNGYGQLGNGTTTSSTTPVDVTGLSNGVAAVAAAYDHTCVVTEVGGVKCWGLNGYGQLGNGTTTSSTTPVDVTGLSSGVAAVAVGGDYHGGHTCALTTGGGVKCWGYNGYGQLGDGTTASSTTPVDVTGLSSGVAAVAAAGGRIYSGHTCAVIDTVQGGGVKCWGKNSSGQLGDGTTTSNTTPVNVSGLSSGVAAVATGGNHTCAVTQGGGAKCWGQNGHGQLGIDPGWTPVYVVGFGGVYPANVLACIEQPPAGAFVSGVVTLRGFAIDLASPTGAGIDMVHIYLDGPYGTGTIIGGATYGLDRPDIAAQHGERFRLSGWELAWDTSGLASGVHRLYLYAHRTTDDGWSVMAPHLVLVPGGPMRWLPLVLRQR